VTKLLAVAAAALTVAVTCTPAATAAPPGSPVDAIVLHDGHGLHIASVKQIDPRLLAVVVQTSALPAPANVYVLLPPGYERKPRKRWPVFYLLHGTSGTASDWTAKGDARRVIGDRQVITVMPDIALDDGGGGWCTDWPNGQQSWERFHIEQLIPWVDANLRTIAKRQQRAIAGLSQGGFCSLSYAARHPDLFATALGYSAAPDIYYDTEMKVGAKLIINGTEMGLTHVPPDTFFGNWLTDGINWAAHDPATLAENLRWTRMYMYWGNGQPGPYDKPDPGIAPAALIEGAVAESNNGFQKRLNSLGIPAYFDPYGAGTHAWPYWTRDLQQSIDKVMADFAHPAANPSGFTYRSADDRYGVYGWDVAMRRSAREFSTLAGVTCRGFALSGSGAATVRTARCYRRGARYRVTMTGPHASSSVVLRAGKDRRLVLGIPLGPANPYQEETLQAQAAGTAVYTTYVTIRGASSPPRRQPSACSTASTAACSRSSTRRLSTATQ
jgi:S-formylglutathione hydrolase FrmB